MRAIFPVTLLAAAAVMAVAAPASAQNASQIRAVQGGASCPGCNLFQADLTGLEARSRNFAGARLRQSDMTAATLNGANFSRSDLRDVIAYGGVFSGANFSGANLAGANFSGAQMGRARGLTQRQLDAACGDDTTQLPGSLRIRSC